MRFFVLLMVGLSLYAASYPKIFSSAGDSVYEGMEQFVKVKKLKVHQERPELFEAFLLDANMSLHKGYALDKKIDDPEESVDKGVIKAYAKELRILSNRKDAIAQQLQQDVSRFYQQKDFRSLRVMHDAGFYLSSEMISQMKAAEQSSRSVKSATPVVQKETQKTVPSIKPANKESTVVAPVKKESETAKVQMDKPVPVVAPKQKSELEYYQESLEHLKEELYTLREEGAPEDGEGSQQMACLNDITAVNYWLIEVFKHDNDACSLRDAIKQMKSYDKAASDSCGRSSMRYIEWHGRIRPYVGKKLFEAEANCHR